MDSWPLAGDLRDYGGKDLNAKWETLSESNSHADSEKDGLRLTMNGGTHPLNDEKRPQKVIVEFLCDKTLVGDENLWNPEDKYDSGKDKRAEREDDEPEDGETGDDTNKPSLQFHSYDTGDVDILRLDWRTKYACLDAKDEKDRDPNGHWGFFTWFIIMYVHPSPLFVILSLIIC